MKLIVGLGNPGREYSQSRHNVGFTCINHLSRRWNIDLSERRRYAVFGQGEVAGEAVVLAKPRVFMNLSGHAIAYLISRFSVQSEDLLVIYDDMDLPLGGMRLRTNGGSAGHRGVESIISIVESRAFSRVRVGIGKPLDNIDPVDYVLGAFLHEERKVMRETTLRVGEALECMLRDGVNTAMNRFN